MRKKVKFEDSSLISPGLIERPAAAVSAADKLIKMKAENRPVWDVIEECVNIWSKFHPKEWRSFLVDLQEKKETRKDRKFGRSKLGSKNTDGQLRYLLDIPEPVMHMVRRLYNPDELPMNDTKFFVEWGKRFPKMKVAEKI